MLEKPDFPDVKIVDCLRTEYRLNVIRVTFLPLGADQNTAVYRVATNHATPYFVKLRRGVFDDMAVVVPKLLHEQGLKHIIAPIATRSQQLWTCLDNFNLTLYPFVDGHNGFQVDLSDHHWVDFGRALKAIHTTTMPPTVTGHIRQEVYSPRWRELVKGFQARIEDTPFSDPVAAELAAFLKSKQDEVSDLVRRAEQLGSALQTKSLKFVLCHADIHAGNILIDTKDTLYIVDWDTLTFAPKERDLMFVGGGLGGGHTAQQEEILFYQGYGQTHINPIALAYYRYERIVQDLAAYCEQILLTDEGGEDREEGLQQLMRQFQPNNVIEMAYRSEKNLPPELQSSP